MSRDVKIDIENVVAQRSKGKLYYYWRTRIGGRTQLIRLPDDPNSAEFRERVDQLNQPAESPPPRAARSFSALIASYRRTPGWSRLSPRSRKDYGGVLDYLEEKIGDQDAAAWRRGLVISMRDRLAEKGQNRRADYAVQLMSILMQHAIDLEWRRDNPAARLERVSRGPGYRPWPEWALAAFLAEAGGVVDLGFRLALAIGPRPGDLVRLRWSDYDGDGIDYEQSKAGGQRVWAPLLPDMIERLAQAKRAARGLRILTDSAGRDLTYDKFEKRFRAVRDRAGCKGYSLHGLRKNAAVTLAEAGASDAQIMACTGHKTSEMVRLYSKGARQKHLARGARDLLQNASATDVAKPVAKPKSGR